MMSAQAAQAEEMEKLIKYAQTAGDWDLYGSLTGTDTSYMKQLSQAELNKLLLGNAKLGRSGSGRSSGGGTPVFDDGGTKKPTTLKIDFKPGPIFDLL